MPFYKIKWTKFGTALIEADNEDEAFEYLHHEVEYDVAEIDGVLEERPNRTGLYDPVSLSKY